MFKGTIASSDEEEEEPVEEKVDKVYESQVRANLTLLDWPRAICIQRHVHWPRPAVIFNSAIGDDN